LVLVLLFFNGLVSIKGATNEGYGEDSTALGQFVDSFENDDNVSIAYQVINNVTLEVMELNTTALILEYENYTTFTEIDEDGDITVLDYDITFDTMRRDAISRVQYDYGVDYFNEFQHEVDVNITDVEAGDVSDRSSPMVWCVANALGQYVGVVSASDSISVWINQVGSTDDKYQLQITWREGGVLQDQSIGIVRNVNDEIYLVVNRTDNDFWLKVYSDSLRSVLNETLTIDNISTTKFRYFYGLMNVGSGNDPADHASGTISNLWFGGYVGGYYLSGYFVTTNYMNNTIVNGTTLVLQTISKIPANTQIQVQFSEDNSTWLNANGVVGGTSLNNGLDTIELRILNYSVIFFRYNFSTTDNSITPYLNQSKLITTIGYSSITIIIQSVVGEWTTYNASVISTVIGTLDAGNLSSTYFIDSDMYNVSEIVGSPAYDIRFNFTDINSTIICPSINIYYYYDGNLAHDFDVEVYNHTDSTWNDIGHIVDSTEYVWGNYSLDRYYDDYISNNEVMIRLNHVSAGNVNHDLSINYIELRGFIPILVVGVTGGLKIYPLFLYIIISIIVIVGGVSIWKK
jgi:hypothetical protein